jgi:hypothetical protein
VQLRHHRELVALAADGDRVDTSWSLAFILGTPDICKAPAIIRLADETASRSASSCSTGT